MAQLLWTINRRVVLSNIWLAVVQCTSMSFPTISWLSQKKKKTKQNYVPLSILERKKIKRPEYKFINKKVKARLIKAVDFKSLVLRESNDQKETNSEQLGSWSSISFVNKDKKQTICKSKLVEIVKNRKLNYINGFQHIHCLPL